MRWASVVVVAATGCRSLLGLDEPIVIAPDAPASPDAPCDAWSVHGIDGCVLPPSTAKLVIAAGRYVLDTNTRTVVDPTGARVEVEPIVVAQRDGTPIAAIVVDVLAIEAAGELVVVGAHPALVAAWTSITIAGTLDVGSHVHGRLGAGANASCGELDGELGAAGAPAGGSGGGGGGALRGAGGTGGAGDNATRPGGRGGTPVASPPPVARGGCAGGRSGAAGEGAMPPSTPATTSAGGAGGGAIALAARARIEVAPTGRILAGGAGGQGAPAGSSCGGGGGGAGGYIALDAPIVEVHGALAANGGGGGGSAEFNGAGMDGEDGTATLEAAHGGAANACAGNGANGAAGTMLAGATEPVTTTCGGGGGGGGAGFVLIFSPSFVDQAVVISPPALANP